MNLKNLIKFFVYAIFFISFFILLRHVCIYAFSSYYLDGFDGAIRMISHYYSKAGFTPYKDFGIVYPPGLFILIGQVIPVATIFGRNLIMGLIFFIFIFIFIYLLTDLNKNKFPFAEVTIFLLVCNVIAPHLMYEVVWFLLMTAIILLSNLYLNKKKNIYLFFIVIFSGFCIFFRWDFIILYLLIILFVVFSSFCINKKFGVKNKWTNLFFATLIGIGIGLLILYLYLLGFHAIKEGFNFIFNIPTLVISKYRDKPFPLPNYQNSLLYVVMFIFVTNCIFEYKKGDLIKIFNSLIPTITVPYAILRGGLGAWRPFLYFVGLSLVLGLRKEKKYFLIKLIMALILVQQIYMWYWPSNFFEKININYASVALMQEIDGCRKVVDKSKFNSIFVGRLSYEKFVINIVSLYFINPHIKPASSYITDEPGLQNSCKYGQIIANQLKTSAKPMLAYLEIETPGIKNENNEMKNMKSCGVIENYLSKAKYKKIGTCTTYRADFEVRLYY